MDKQGFPLSMSPKEAKSENKLYNISNINQKYPNDYSKNIHTGEQEWAVQKNHIAKLTFKNGFHQHNTREGAYCYTLVKRLKRN